MASFQGTQVRGSDIGKHRAVELFWPKQILLRTTLIHLLVLKLIHLFSAYLMPKWFFLYLLSSKNFNQFPTDSGKRKSMSCGLCSVAEQMINREIFFPKFLKI